MPNAGGGELGGGGGGEFIAGSRVGAVGCAVVPGWAPGVVGWAPGAAGCVLGPTIRIVI